MDKETKRKISVTAIGILGIILLLVGTSLATFSSNLTGIEVNTIKSGCLKVDMEDEGSLNAINEVPIKDEDGLKKKAYVYTITNNCTTDALYTTTINVIEGSNEDNLGKLKVSLKGDSYLAPTIESTLDPDDLLDDSLTNVSKTYRLDEGYLKVGEEKTFELRTWIDYNVQTIEGYVENKIVIGAVASDNLTINYDRNTSAFNTLNNNTILNNMDYSTLAPSDNQLSGIIENKLSNGSKYYFRGAPNNKFEFANLDFRVLSTNDDGSINIVLDNTLEAKTYAEAKEYLNTWYEENIKTEESYVKTDATFCEETSNAKGNYYAKIKVDKANPTNKCESSNTISKVGMLTVDDLMFAGAVKDSPNNSFYLKSENSYFTSSHSGENKVYAYTKENSITEVGEEESLGIKPVITIVKDAMIEGKGTDDEPFYISGRYNEEKIVLEDEPPTIVSLKTDARWSMNDKHIYIYAKDDATGSGLAGYYIKKDDSTKPEAMDAGWEASHMNKYTSVNAYDNGTYYVFAKDNNNNVSEGKRIVISKVDKVAPNCTIRINPPTSTTNYKTLTVLSDDKDVDISGYTWDDSDEKTDVLKVTKNAVYTAHIKDLAGNENTCNATVLTLGGGG